MASETSICSAQCPKQGPTFTSEMCYMEDILYRGQRVVILKSVRNEDLRVLHQAHQGMVKSKQLACHLTYSPNIGKEIEDSFQMQRVSGGKEKSVQGTAETNIHSRESMGTCGNRLV